jgi:hypothetical protein
MKRQRILIDFETRSVALFAAIWHQLFPGRRERVSISRVERTRTPQ